MRNRLLLTFLLFLASCEPVFAATYDVIGIPGNGNSSASTCNYKVTATERRRIKWLGYQFNENLIANNIITDSASFYFNSPIAANTYPATNCPAGWPHSSASEEANLLIDLGVDPTKIIIQQDSTSTQADITNQGTIMTAHSWTTTYWAATDATASACTVDLNQKDIIVGGGFTIPNGLTYTDKPYKFSPVAKIPSAESQFVTVNTQVTLHGGATKNDTTVTPSCPTSDISGSVTYVWRQILGPIVTLSSTTAQNPTFTPSSTGDYRFRVKVTLAGVEGGGIPGAANNLSYITDEASVHVTSNGKPGGLSSAPTGKHGVVFLDAPAGPANMGAANYWRCDMASDMFYGGYAVGDSPNFSWLLEGGNSDNGSGTSAAASTVSGLCLEVIKFRHNISDTGDLIRDDTNTTLTNKINNAISWAQNTANGKSAYTELYTISSTTDAAAIQTALANAGITNYAVTSSVTANPIVALAASSTAITAGQSSTLTWTSQNATSCTASGSWSGNQSLNNTSPGVVVSPTADATYTLTCNGQVGSASSTVSISVTQSPPQSTSTDAFNPLLVQLNVTESAGLARTNEPVTTTIPIPFASSLTDINGLRITQSDGTTNVPAQFTVVTRWGGLPSDTSKMIKNLMVDFQATVSANSTVNYFLRTGGSGNTGTGMTIISDANQFSIATGNATYLLSKNGLVQFGSVDVGNGNMLGDITSDGAWIKDASAAYWCTCKLVVTAATLEVNGPLRSVVVLRGKFSSDGTAILHGGDAATYWSGGDVAQNKDMEFQERFTFYYNKSYAIVEPSLENNGNGWPGAYPGNKNNSLYVGAYYLQTTLNLGATRTLTQDGYTNANVGGNAYEVLQTQPGTSTDETTNFLYASTKDGSGVGSNGTRGIGYADLSDATQGLTVATEYFWQLSPKGFHVTGQVFDTDVLPDVGSNYQSRGGQYLTNRMLYYFHNGTYSGASSANAVTAFNNPLVFTARATWYADTQVWGFLAPNGLTSGDSTLQLAYNRFEQYQLCKIDSTQCSNAESITTYRETRLMGNWYGWNDFGDNRWSAFPGVFSGLQYDWPFILQLHYLRTGNRKFWDLGRSMYRHMADFDINHGTGDTGYAAWFLGQVFWEQNSHYSTPNSLTGLMEQNQGYCMAYLITGQQRWLDTCKLAADEAWTYWNNYLSTAPNYIRSESRIYGWAILRLITYYKVSGDQNYLNNALTIFTSGVLATEQSAVPPGGIGSAGNGFVYDDPANNDCIPVSGNYRVRVLMMGYLDGPLIELHRLSGYAPVINYLKRMLDYVKNTVYVGGDSSSGNYRPYQVPYCYTPANGNGEFRDIQVIYNNFFADGYAYLYQNGYGQTYLDFARNLFKDEQRYWEVTSNTYVVPSTYSNIYLGYEPQTTKQQGWIGRFNQPYLNTEYQLINAGVVPLPPPAPPPPLSTVGGGGAYR